MFCDLLSVNLASFSQVTIIPLGLLAATCIFIFLPMYLVDRRDMSDSDEYEGIDLILFWQSVSRLTVHEDVVNAGNRALIDFCSSPCSSSVSLASFFPSSFFPVFDATAFSVVLWLTLVGSLSSWFACLELLSFCFLHLRCCFFSSLHRPWCEQSSIGSIRLSRCWRNFLSAGRFQLAGLETFSSLRSLLILIAPVSVCCCLSAVISLSCLVPFVPIFLCALFSAMQCYNARWREYATYAGFMIAIYPVVSQTQTQLITRFGTNNLLSSSFRFCLSCFLVSSACDVLFQTGYSCVVPLAAVEKSRQAESSHRQTATRISLRGSRNLLIFCLRCLLLWFPFSQAYEPKMFWMELVVSACLFLSHCADLSPKLAGSLPQTVKSARDWVVS